MIISDDVRKIKIEDRVLELIYVYRQTSIFMKEAGGILVGHEMRSTSNLIIDFATVPMKGDRRKRTRFYRESPLHIDAYNELYTDSGGTDAYFGEWHTHPEKTPDYSSMDCSNWKKIYKELPDKHPLYFIIVGIDSIGIWMLQDVEHKPLLLEKESWSNLIVSNHLGA